MGWFLWYRSGFVGISFTVRVEITCKWSYPEKKKELKEKKKGKGSDGSYMKCTIARTRRPKLPFGEWVNALSA